MLGLGLSLQAIGKEIQMVLSDIVPMSMRHLEGSKQILHDINAPVDFSITVDCSDSQRIGWRLKSQSAPDLNIDHHPTNENFGKINLVDPSASATAEILAELLPSWRLPISVGVASALLTGIITDTIGFRTSNVTARTMRNAAELVDYGAKISELYLSALVHRSYESTRFWGAGLSHLSREKNPLSDDVKVRWSIIADNIKAISLEGIDLDGFLYHYWLASNAFTQKRDIFKSVRETVKNKVAAKKLLDDLVVFSEVYRDLHEPGIRKWRNDELEIKSALESINRFRVRHPLPLMMTALRKYDLKALPKGELVKLLQIIEIFTFINTSLLEPGVPESAHIVRPYKWA